MSTDLKRYLLAGAKDMKDSGPSPYEGELLQVSLLRRRKATKDKVNRLSLDLDLIKKSQIAQANGYKPGKQAILYSKSTSDALANDLKRRSLNLEYLQQGPKRRTVHFDLPDSPGRLCLENDSADEGSGACRSRSRRRRQTEEGTPQEEISLVGVNQHLCQLMEVQPQSYAEAQRLKKMLKRAVSGPEATFEDLKSYRLAMKKLRKVVALEQEKELDRAEKESSREREFHNFMEKLGSSSYGSRYGTTSGSSAASSYLSSLNKDRSTSQDRAGYGSDYSRSGYGSGSGSTAYNSKYSSRAGSGISSIASKFGETKASTRSRDACPLPSYSPSTSTAASKPPSAFSSSYSTARTRDTNVSGQSPQVRETTISSFTPRTRDSADTNSSLSKNNSGSTTFVTRDQSTVNTPSRSRGSGLSSLSSTRTRGNEYTSSRTKELPTDSSLRARTDDVTTRTRTRELPLSQSNHETNASKLTSSPYASKYSTGSNYEKSGYTSDTKSGYGSDYNRSGYGSGYGSGAESYKKYSWSRSNSFMKDHDVPTTPTTPTTYTRPSYSRQNSYLSSDTGSGSNWRSRLYGNDQSQTKTSPTPTSPSSRDETKEAKLLESDIKKPPRPSAFQTAIGKLSQESKENSSKDDKKPDLLSPNAVKVLPSFGLADMKLKNKAPADFTSDSDDSDKETQVAAKSEKVKSDDSAPQEKKVEVIKPLPPKLVATAESSLSTRPLSHLCAAPSLPERRDHSTSQGFIAAPTFKKSAKYVTSMHEFATSTPTPSKWLRNNEDNRSPSPRNNNEANLNSVKPTSNSPSLPSSSPVLDKRKDIPSSTSELISPTSAKQLVVDVANKDCRKSVLNMDIQPEDQEAMRRQQEEKREELRRLRKQLTLDDNIQTSSLATNQPQTTVQSQPKPKEESNAENLKTFSESSPSSEEEEKKDEKPPPAPSLEKASSKSKLIERKHSKGKCDSLKRSGSFRRQRERQSSAKETSTSSSSDSESEAKSIRARTNSFTRTRKRGSRDDMSGRRTRNNSESLAKVGSKGNIPKSLNNSKGSLIDKSNNSSRNSLLGEKKLSLGPDIDIGESSHNNSNQFSLKNKQMSRPGSRSENIVNGNTTSHNQTYLKQKKESQSISSSSSSDSSDDSSDSAGEEGCLFSISKSKSMKKSKYGLNKLSTSPSSKLCSDTGVEEIKDSLQNNCSNNLSNEKNDIPEVECTFNLVIPYNKKDKSVLSSKSVNAEFSIYNLENISKSSSKSNVASRKSPYIDNNTDGDVSEMPEDDTADIPSKSSSKHDLNNPDINNTDANEYQPFEWATGSPEIVRKPLIQNVENIDDDITTADNTEGYNEFQWPEGSPDLSRKKPSCIKAEWDTDTETEMTQNEWSDASPPISKMPQVAEETADDVAFEWPSSPELSRKHPLVSGYDTQNEVEPFEWPSSPELPVMKDPKFITFTTDIDNLLNDGNVHGSFTDMEKTLGLSSQTEENNIKKDVEEEGEESEKEEEKTDKEEKVAEIEDAPEIELKTEIKVETADRNLSLRERARRNLSLFIDELSSIDDILNSVLRPLTHRQEEKMDEDSILQEIPASQVKVHDAQENRAQIDENIEEIDASAVIIRKKEKREALRAEIIKAVKEGLDDATLQVYRDGDYGTYLDLEASLAEQADDIEGLTDSKKNAIILRTQLSVRVHAIIEKLLNSEGRELRRALFSLKQIFQDDKDLVHAFVQNDGLKCLVKVGSSADHNYQTYILRALGQVMLYVDGMTGISNSPETLEWLYSLVSSKFRLVVKTALKLLLVFVEYSEHNAMRLAKAIGNVDRAKGDIPWAIIMRLLEGKDCPDTELQIYAMTLVNKTLNGLPDQDSYYDQTDFLEEQDMETLIQKFIHNPNSDLDLLQQLTIYEAVLAYEDGDDVCRTRTIDPTIRQDLRYASIDREDANRRKSKRHFITPEVSERKSLDDGITSSDDEHRGHVTVINIKGGLPTDDLGGIKHSDAGVTPALRRRRERAERQKTFLNDQEMISESRRESQSPEGLSTVEDENRKNSEISWLLELMQAKKDGEVKDIAGRIASLMDKENIESNKRLPIELMADSHVKDILDKLSRGASLTAAEKEKLTRLGDVSGRIQKAKGDLIKAQSKGDMRPQKTPEPPKKSENDLHWENLVSQLNRPLQLCDLDFTDLNEEDDKDIYSITHGGIPPPPPPPPPPAMAPGIPGIPPPPPMENGHANTDDENGVIPYHPPSSIPPPPPLEGSHGVPFAPPLGHKFGVALAENRFHKSKKTIKLFWREIREDVLRKSSTIWESVQPVHIDVQKLEHLFESRAKDLNAKKQQDQKGIKEVTVLDSKRSNVINIGMTKLPPPRTIKTAILKMDSSIINREGIEKLLLTMLPTADEKKMIQEAAILNPELPLGSAEQFLMMLASISELPARLKLWLFKLDFEVMEKEVAEPLMDLKQGILDIQKNRTFSIILSILLSVGNFLNSTESKGFQIDYLSKVPEVKDTVHKHSLLHHLCHMVIEKFPETSDLYSELGAITRASKVDFDELQNTIEKMETDCKASWDHLKAIAKHDGPTQMKLKMSEFLADGAERIIVLGIIYRRVIHRFKRFLIWLGMPPNAVLESKPQNICSIVSEFALEYRTCRERVLQQIQKKANHRERNKTRGKMITEMEKFKSRPKTKEEEADNDLRQLLNYSDVSDTEAIRGKNTWRRTREGKTRSRGDESMAEMLLLNADGVDDALLDSLVKTATQTPSTRSNPRERKRSRHADRKSLKRSRTRDRNLINELEALQALAAKE